MKAVKLQFSLLLLVTVVEHISAIEVDNPSKQIYESVPEHDLTHRQIRFKRQTPTTTTPKPKKNRPSNIFSLISVLISETRDDTNRAFNEIGSLFNAQFSNQTTTKAPPTSTTSSTTSSSSSSSSSSSDSDEDNEITTTESFRISRDEFLGILRSNVQGLVQLFGKEFRVAIRDSNKNVREFGRDLGNALRPYFN